MLASVLGCLACGEELYLPLVLWCLAWEAEVMLASVLGCLECGEEFCLTFDATVPGLLLVLWCLAWATEVILALVLGCFSFVEGLCFTLDATVPGLGGRGGASFSVRLLGMSSCAMSLRCCYGAWLEKRR